MDHLFDLEIYGKNIPVYEDDLEFGIAGNYDLENHCILISKDLDYIAFVQTLIHEIGHAIFDRMGLRQTYGHNLDVEEIIVEAYGTFFTEAFEFDIPEKIRKRTGRKVRKKKKKSNSG